MTITDLIADLKKLEAEHGDVPVYLHDYDRYGDAPQPRATPSYASTSGRGLKRCRCSGDPKHSGGIRMAVWI